MTLLKVNNLTKKFSGLTAVNEVNFEINNKEIVGLIGPNGAGKTTIFNLITGFLEPTSGIVIFNDEKISDLKSHEISRKGIFRTFQTIRLFPDLSVLENVLIGAQMDNESGFVSTIFNSKQFLKNEKKIREYSEEILKTFNLLEEKNQIAGYLPYGTQRIVEIVRALVAKPKLIFLDEPVAGMNSEESLFLSDAIMKIREKFDISIVIVEHDVNFVMGLCDKILVLNYGNLIAEGKPNEIKNNEEVIEAYLGREEK